MKRSPGPLTGLAVAVSGIVLLLALTLACRIMIALDRGRRRTNRIKSLPEADLSR